MKLFATLLFVFTSCSMLPEVQVTTGDQELIRIINWNLQTFFDSNTIGTEYDDFKGSKSNWNEEKYQSRLKYLAQFIVETKADVYIFQEIENSAILQDLANELVLSKIPYEYSCFSKQENEALGIAILSHYPLKNITAHQLDVRTALGFSSFETSSTILDGMLLEQPSLRPIVHAEIELSNNNVFSIYACHWKSKFGGAESSEVWRNAQEILLADLLLQEKNAFLVTGDFNRTLEEFLANKSNVEKKPQSVLMQGSKSSIEVVSSWLTFKNKTSAPGSYYFQEKWEKIDHFFYSDTLRVIDFETVTEEGNTNSEGTPFRYDVYTGRGVSDHIPLLCVVEM